MPNTINDDGFQKARFQDLREETAESYRERFGQDIKTDRSAVFGQLISIDTQAEDELAGLIQQLLAAFDPRQASGVLLSRLAAVMGTNRIAGIKSTVQIDVTTNKTTLLRTGFTVKNQDGIEFKTSIDTNLPQGTTSITLESDEFGSFDTPAGTLTLVSTPVFGVVSVTNPFPAVLGNARETDAQLRSRLINGQLSTSQTITGVNSLISTIPGVQSFKVTENRTDIAFANGQLPHSLFIVIDGGSDADIAETLIDDAVAAGIDYSAPTGVTLTTGTFADPVSGQVHSAQWARPAAVDFYVTLELEVLGDYTNDDSVLIRNAIVDFYNQINHIGGVIYSSELYCPVTDATNRIQNVVNIFIGDTPAPTSNSFDLGFVGKINLPASNIVVTII